MPREKKLQVFVSSTFEDLQYERQAAVEAILMAGHIPAGMELFAAGDEEQMQVIRDWIDESDVFLLILGQRYGSIEPESKKSYVHLEFDYALEKNKPHFAVVMSSRLYEEKMRGHDPNPSYKAFRDFVTTNRMVRTWEDKKDIRLYVMEALKTIDRRENLLGWIRGDKGMDSEVANQLARLLKENEELRRGALIETFSGLTFEQLCDTLNSQPIILLEEKPDARSYKDFETLKLSAIQNSRSEPTAYDYFLFKLPEFLHGISYRQFDQISEELAKLGLLLMRGSKQEREYYLSEVGQRFYAQIRLRSLNTQGNATSLMDDAGKLP